MKDKRPNRKREDEEIIRIAREDEPAYKDVSLDDDYPEVEGLTRVDAYYVEDHMVDYYIEQREKFAKEIAWVYSDMGYNAMRDWAGSEDGEAIIAIDKKGAIAGFIHLDPYETDNLIAAEKEGRLIEEIKSSLDKKEER